MTVEEKEDLLVAKKHISIALNKLYDIENTKDDKESCIISSAACAIMEAQQELSKLTSPPNTGE